MDERWKRHMKEIGQRIDAAIRMRGFTKSEFRALLGSEGSGPRGSSPATLDNLTNRSKPSVANVLTLIHYGELLAVRPEWLLTGKGPPDREGTDHAIDFDALGLGSLDPSVQQKLGALAERVSFTRGYRSRDNLAERLQALDTIVRNIGALLLLPVHTSYFEAPPNDDPEGYHVYHLMLDALGRLPHRLRGDPDDEILKGIRAAVLGDSEPVVSDPSEEESWLNSLDLPLESSDAYDVTP